MVDIWQYGVTFLTGAALALLCGSIDVLLGLSPGQTLLVTIMLRLLHKDLWEK